MKYLDKIAVGVLNALLWLGMMFIVSWISEGVGFYVTFLQNWFVIWFIALMTISTVGMLWAIKPRPEEVLAKWEKEHANKGS